jgi:adenylate kinase
VSEGPIRRFPVQSSAESQVAGPPPVKRRDGRIRVDFMTRRQWIGALAMAVAPAATTGGEAPGKGMVIVLIGPPGAGKTTQARFLKKHYGIPFFSAAEIVRKSHGKKSKISRKLEPQAASGELLGDDALNQLMLQAFKKSDFTRGFILDGYPANRVQVEFFAGALRELRLPEPAAVVLEVQDNVARERMTKRGRADDKPATIERRLSDYRAEIETIRQAYPPARVFPVDGTKSEPEISREIVRLLDGVR